MKNKILLALMFFLFPLIARAENKNICLNIKDMSCAMCAARVEGALKKVDGVTKCSVDNKTAKGSCDYDDTKTSADKILEACNKTGFKCEKCE
ncbi:MAG: heavy-metal-associated domain-containing protein [Deltaproteobacteria bacterium]|nr:heavy-metal-associated domain-containing protein [Deltaproteobacteria bacterium]